MSSGLAFWIIMLIWLLFSTWSAWQAQAGQWPFWSGNFVVFALLLLLGWKVFGPPING